MKSQVIFFFIFLISFASAIQLGVSPPRIEFTSDNICRNVSVFSDNYFGYISMGSSWSENKSSVEFSYPAEFNLDGEKEITICARSADNFRGIILFKAKNGNLEVGILVKSNYTEEGVLSSDVSSGVSSDIVRFTGAAIGSGLLSWKMMAFESAFLLVVLVLLLIVNKKRGA